MGIKALLHDDSIIETKNNKERCVFFIIRTHKNHIFVDRSLCKMNVSACCLLHTYNKRDERSNYIAYIYNYNHEYEMDVRCEICTGNKAGHLLNNYWNVSVKI